jgi:hypothetical protein
MFGRGSGGRNGCRILSAFHRASSVPATLASLSYHNVDLVANQCISPREVKSSRAVNLLWRVPHADVVAHVVACAT